MRKQTSIPTLPLLLALLAGCDADSDPRDATVSRMDAVPFPMPMPITDTDGSDSGGSDTDGSDTDGSDTGDMANCEPLDPERHGLSLAVDFELPPGSEEFICDDGELQFDDEGLQEIGAWEPAGACSYMQDFTGFLPPPALFEVDCEDHVGVKVDPKEDGGKDERVCKVVFDASEKCLAEASKQCDAYAAGKGGKPKFTVDYKYKHHCYYSKAKRVRNLGPVGVVCDGTMDRDATWTCEVTPVG